MQTKYAALFPGQGAQYPGMIREMLSEFPWTRVLFEEASDALHLNLVKLCLDGPSDELQLTTNAQPAILTTSFAWFEILRKTVDFNPQAGAGHSLGEYSALLASGAATLSQLAPLVQERGRLMQSAVPKGMGKMVALLGLEDAQAQALCAQASQGQTSLVVPANYNSPGQIVLAGHADAVDRAAALAASAEHPEFKARKVIPLNVSAPFHCPLMAPVVEAFHPSLAAVRWHKPRFPIAHNVDAVLTSDAPLVDRLSTQIDHPVLWTRCQQSLANAGFSHYFEMGPGKVLTGLGRRIFKEGTFQSVDAPTDIKAVESFFKEAVR